MDCGALNNGLHFSQILGSRYRKFPITLIFCLGGELERKRRLFSIIEPARSKLASERETETTALVPIRHLVLSHRSGHRQDRHITHGSRFHTIGDETCFLPFHSSAVISHISAGNRPAT